MLGVLGNSERLSRAERAYSRSRLAVEVRVDGEDETRLDLTWRLTPQWAPHIRLFRGALGNRPPARKGRVTSRKSTAMPSPRESEPKAGTRAGIATPSIV